MRCFYEERTALILVLLYLIPLTIDLQTIILGRKNLPSQEVIMSEEKLRILRQSHTLHPHPDQVRDPAWERSGLLGLLPEPTGPRQAHKLTEEVLVLLRPIANTMSSTQLATWLRDEWQLSVHPRSIERALARPAKKGGLS